MFRNSQCPEWQEGLSKRSILTWRFAEASGLMALASFAVTISSLPGVAHSHPKPGETPAHAQAIQHSAEHIATLGLVGSIAGMVGFTVGAIRYIQSSSRDVSAPQITGPNQRAQ